jgi:hypothetical protein
MNNKNGRINHARISFYHKNNQSTSYFYDIFLDRNFFEIGLTASVDVKMNYEQEIEPLVAKDKTLEIDELVPILFKEGPLNQFISSKEKIFKNQ